MIDNSNCKVEISFAQNMFNYMSYRFIFSGLEKDVQEFINTYDCQIRFPSKIKVNSHVNLLSYSLKKMTFEEAADAYINFFKIFFCEHRNASITVNDHFFVTFSFDEEPTSMNFGEISKEIINLPNDGKDFTEIIYRSNKASAFLEKHRDWFKSYIVEVFENIISSSSEEYEDFTFFDDL
jgi:hypothetical protein